MERALNITGAVCAAILGILGVLKAIITGARRWDRLMERLESLEQGATAVDVRLGRIEHVLTRQQHNSNGGNDDQQRWRDVA